MKEKKYKDLNDLLEDYHQLSDEAIELPILIEKHQKKYNQLFASQNDDVLKPRTAENMYKIFSQIKKHEERLAELRLELSEVEKEINEFLTFLNGGKISYERKDDNDKSKLTYLFWLEDGQVKCNR